MPYWPSANGKVFSVYGLKKKRTHRDRWLGALFPTRPCSLRFWWGVWLFWAS